mgnify:CR=1 FL=1
MSYANKTLKVLNKIDFEMYMVIINIHAVNMSILYFTEMQLSILFQKNRLTKIDKLAILNNNKM